MCSGWEMVIVFEAALVAEATAEAKTELEAEAS